MTEAFIPLEDSEGFPFFEKMVSQGEYKDRVDLREVPLETCIEFHGRHPDSYYFMQVIGPESARQVKVWFKGRAPAAVAPIECIVAVDYSKVDWKQEKEGAGWEKGVMQVELIYHMPHFYYEDKKLRIDPQMRGEPYTEIRVLLP
ncbi:MAG: hypothetical protein V1743_02600 [Nanoarchaeota archaeon]